MNPEEVGVLERLVNRNMELRAFIIRLLDPEDLGHAVSAEVRQAARDALRVKNEPQQAA